MQDREEIDHKSVDIQSAWSSLTIWFIETVPNGERETQSNVVSLLCPGGIDS